MINIPNAITFARILLIPVFVALLLRYRETSAEPFRWWAITAFGVAVISDSLDGFIARLKHQKTLIGTFLDPLADKLLILTAVVILSLPIGPLARLPSWFAVLVISRDLCIVLGSLLIHMIRGRITPRPSAAGKFTTFLQMLTVVWILLRIPYHQAPLYAAAALTLISGIMYTLDGLRQLHAASGD